MNRSTGSFLTLAVLISLAANSGFRASAPREDAIQNLKAGSAREHVERQNGAAGARKKCAVDRNSYLGSLYDAVRVTFSAANTTLSSGSCPEAVRVPNGTRMAIALVPDPVHTHLALQFDRHIDAIQQAVQDSGWIFDHALMPWDNKEHSESSDVTVRLKGNKHQQEQEDQPGLLIFRAHPPDSTVKLLVFVVGESPTAGIRKPQAANAFAMAETLWKGQWPKTIAILGPTFSGSLASLSDFLSLKCTKQSTSLLCNAGHILLISGTVTGTDAVETFRAQVEGRRPQVLFASMQESDKNAILRFLKYAMRHDYFPQQIALLSEDETAYGTHSTKQEVGKAISDQQSANDRYGKEGLKRDDSKTNKYDDANLQQAESKMLKLYFPREISQLRAAYQKNGDATESEKTPRTTLPMDMTATGDDGDTVRQYSQKQLPLSQEAVLLGIVAELRKHDVQIVLVSASDPLDQLFLSRFLRTAYPAGQIVTLGADLLFAREMDSRLRGILALTTYSLVAGADHEDGNEKHNDRVFPSTLSVGIYNGMKLLLMASDPVNAKNGGFPGLSSLPGNPDLFEYALPQSYLSNVWDNDRQLELQELRCIPPVHLTVLGNDGYWDITVLAPHGQTESAGKNAQGGAEKQPCIPNAGAPADGIQSDWTTALPFITRTATDQADNMGTADDGSSLLPNGWLLLVLAGIAVSLGYVYLCWTASILASSEAVAHLAPPGQDSRGMLFAAASYLHLLLMGTLYWPYKSIAEPHPWQQGAILVTIAAVVISGILDLCRREARRLAVTFALASLATCGILFYPWKGPSLHYFALRSVHLTSGVSPLLPIFMLITAALWGTWYALSGSCLADSRRPRLPVLPAKGTPLHQKLLAFSSVMEADQKRLLGLLKADHIDWTILAFATAVMLTLGLSGESFRKFRLVYSAERNGYEYILGALIACVVIVLIYTVFRIQKTWMELRLLLLSLDSSPIRRIFGSLKELGFAWSPIWQMGAANLSESRRLLSRQLEALANAVRLGVPGIAKIAENEDVGLNAQLENMRITCQKAKETSNVLERAGIEKTLLDEYEAFQAAMAEAGMEALAFCAGHWVTYKPKGTPATAANKRNGTLAAASNNVNGTPAVAANNGKGTPAAVANNGKGTPAEESNSDDPDEVEVKADSGGSGGIMTALVRIKKAFTAKPVAAQEQLGACEQFLALMYAAFILAVVVRIRTLMMAVGGMYVFFLLALTSYPFQPQVAIRMVLVTLLVFIVAIVATVYAQMHRDATLSYITSTTPGELGKDFWIRMAAFIAVPAFSLVASQFPTIGGTLNSWLQPAMAALK